MINGLGYLGISSIDPDLEWQAFASHVLGMQVTRAPDGETLWLRMDDARSRIIVQKGDNDAGAFYGWEVDDAATLESVSQRVEASGSTVNASSAEERQLRHVDAMRWFHDPAGHRVELFHGLETDPEPFQPARPIAGFVTGPLGLGHVVLLVETMDEVKAFYLDVLGFRVSDYMTAPFNAAFLRTNPRHHSVALLEAGAVALHHFMVEVEHLDDVGSAYDVVESEKIEIVATLGRHSNDRMLSFYMRSPSGFQIEYGWDGLLVAEDLEAVELTQGPSIWGHAGIG